MSTVSNAIQMLVPSEASALPRGANTRDQNVRPNSCGNLLGKYHFSANAQRNRFASGPKMTKASNASKIAMPSVLDKLPLHAASDNGSCETAVAAPVIAQLPSKHGANKTKRQRPPRQARSDITHWRPRSRRAY